MAASEECDVVVEPDQEVPCGGEDDGARVSECRKGGSSLGAQVPHPHSPLRARGDSERTAGARIPHPHSPVRATAGPPGPPVAKLSEMSRETVEFIQRLVEAFPALEEDYENHVENYGETLPHVSAAMELMDAVVGAWQHSGPAAWRPGQRNADSRGFPGLPGLPGSTWRN